MVWKIVFLFSLCYVLQTDAVSPEFVEKFMTRLQEIAEKCVPEVNAGDDDIAALISHTIPKSHEGKCLLFCFQKTFNMMHPDGRLNRAGAIDSLADLRKDDPDMYDRMLGVFGFCGSTTKEDPDPCLTSASMVECAMIEGKKFGVDASILA